MNLLLQQRRIFALGERCGGPEGGSWWGAELKARVDQMEGINATVAVSVSVCDAMVCDGGGGCY